MTDDLRVVCPFCQKNVGTRTGQRSNRLEMVAHKQRKNGLQCYGGGMLIERESIPALRAAQGGHVK